MVVKRNGQLGKASSSFYLCCSFYYNVLLALIRDMVGSSSLAPEGQYKVLWYVDLVELNVYQVFDVQRLILVQSL